MTGENTEVNTDAESLRQEILSKNVTEITHSICPAFCVKINEVYDKPMDWLNESTNDLVNQFFDLNRFEPNTILKHYITGEYLTFNYNLNSSLSGLHGFSMVVEHDVLHTSALTMPELIKFVTNKKSYINQSLTLKYANYLRRLEKIHIIKIRPVTKLIWKTHRLRNLNPQQVELYEGMQKYDDWTIDTDWKPNSNILYSIEKDTLPILMFSKIVKDIE